MSAPYCHRCDLDLRGKESFGVRSPASMVDETVCASCLELDDKDLPARLCDNANDGQPCAEFYENGCPQCDAYVAHYTETVSLVAKLEQSIVDVKIRKALREKGAA